jgi:hypothetical protein
MAEPPPVEEDPRRTNAASAEGDVRIELLMKENSWPLFSREIRSVDGSCYNDRNIRWGSSDRVIATNTIDNCVYPAGQDCPGARHFC